MRTRHILFPALAFMLALAAPAIVSALTLQVWPDGSGSYPTIQDGINTATPGDTVLLNEGTYLGEGNHGLDFLGKDIVLRGTGEREDVVIDCEYLDLGLYIHTGETSAALIEALTITHGMRDSKGVGGAILCEASNPTFRNLLLIENQQGAGGGMCIRNASPVIEDVVFEDNDVTGLGGGLYLYYSSPAISDCVFIGNHSSTQGGGIGILGECSAEFVDCQILDCIAGTDGGGLNCGGGEPVFIRCSFEGNLANRGGGVWVSGARPKIYQSTFYNNWADNYGGAMCIVGASVTSQATISKSLVYGNRTDYGCSGILCMEGAQPKLENLTIVGNQWMGHDGAGVSSYTVARPEVVNCIIAFNEGPGICVGGYADISVSCSDVYSNLVGDYMGVPDQTGLDGNISEDPYFCDLDEWVLTLAEQSPCLPENNDCGVLIGALGEDCTLTAADELPMSPLSLAVAPNPFNPSTRISFTLADPAPVSLRVLDVSGRCIATLLDQPMDAGDHELQWTALDANGKPLPSGVYLLALESGGELSTQKMVLMK